VLPRPVRQNRLAATRGTSDCAADRGRAADRGGQRQLTVRTLLAGMCLAAADHDQQL
jgi:hypothetical protein